MSWTLHWVFVNCWTWEEFLKPNNGFNSRQVLCTTGLNILFLPKMFQYRKKVKIFVEKLQEKLKAVATISPCSRTTHPTILKFCTKKAHNMGKTSEAFIFANIWQGKFIWLFSQVSLFTKIVQNVTFFVIIRISSIYFLS